MLGQRIRVGPLAQLVEQLGRALDVREQESNSAGGKLALDHTVRVASGN